MMSVAGATGPLARAREEAARLVRLFDRKPIVEPCGARRCENVATRCSLYSGSVAPRWWCSECDPAQDCFSPGKLTLVRTYTEAANYVDLHCGGRKDALRSLVRELARAKGLPPRAG